MNQFLWSCAALLTLFVTVESLRCNTCDVKILGSCFGDTPVNCTGNQNSCFSAVATFSADMLPIHQKGCIEAKQCTNQTNVPLLSVTYNITRSCCTSDLCNRAASVQLPLTAALGAALVALWNQWGP